MYLALSTGCLYLMPLRTACRLAAECGLEAIELAMAPEVWLAGPQAAGRVARAHGLRIATVHQALLPISPAGSGPRRALDAVRAALVLEAPHVVFHGTWAPHWDDPAAQEWLRTVEACQRELAGSGTRLALENHGLRAPTDAASVVGSLPAVCACAERLDLDITLDTCHAGSFGLDLVEAYRTVAERLVDIHLCDTRPPCASRSATLRYMSSQHFLVGQGQLDFGPLLRRLQADAYAGPLTLEVTPQSLQVWSPRRRAAHLAEMVAYIEQQRASEPIEREPSHHALQTAHL